MRPVALLLIAALGLASCVSSRPRPYAPTLTRPVADQAGLERDFAACSRQVASGRSDFSQSKGAVAAQVGGAALLVGTAAALPAMGAAAVYTSGGMAATASLGATGVGLLLVPPLAGYILSTSKRAKNETAVQTAMNACLAHGGHGVSAWTRLSNKQARAASMVSPTRASP